MMQPGMMGGMYPPPQGYGQSGPGAIEVVIKGSQSHANDGQTVVQSATPTGEPMEQIVCKKCKQVTQYRASVAKTGRIRCKCCACVEGCVCMCVCVCVCAYIDGRAMQVVAVRLCLSRRASFVSE